MDPWLTCHKPRTGLPGAWPARGPWRARATAGTGRPGPGPLTKGILLIRNLSAERTYRNCVARASRLDLAIGDLLDLAVVAVEPDCGEVTELVERTAA